MQIIVRENKIDTLKREIDSLANDACTVMNEKERAQYLNDCLRKKNNKGVYYKGAKKGQIKDYYNVDGRLFNQLWEKLRPYVYVSVLRSKYYNNSDVEDTIMTVRERLFYNLRHYGSVYEGEAISSRIKLIVINSLTIEANHSKRLSTSVFYGASSLSVEEVDSSSADCLEFLHSEEKVQLSNNNTAEDGFWYEDVPREYEKVLCKVLGKDYHKSFFIKKSDANSSVWYENTKNKIIKNNIIDMIYYIKQYEKSENLDDKLHYFEKIYLVEENIFMGLKNVRGNKGKGLYINNNEIKNYWSMKMNKEANTILAKDVKVGETYLSFTRRFKVVVDDIITDASSGVVTSVSVHEVGKTTQHHLPVSAKLIIIDNEEDAAVSPVEKKEAVSPSELNVKVPNTNESEVQTLNKNLDNEENKNNNIINFPKGEKIMNETDNTATTGTEKAPHKVSKSTIIDQHLTEVKSVEKTTFNDIADKVIAAGHDTVENKKSLVAYVRTRWYRFFKTPGESAAVKNQDDTTATTQNNTAPGESIVTEKIPAAQATEAVPENAPAQ